MTEKKQKKLKLEKDPVLPPTDVDERGFQKENAYAESEQAKIDDEKPNCQDFKSLNVGDIVKYFPAPGSKSLDNDATYAAAIVVGCCEEFLTANLKVFRDADQPDRYVPGIKHVSAALMGEAFFLFKDELKI